MSNHQRRNRMATGHKVHRIGFSWAFYLAEGEGNSGWTYRRVSHHRACAASACCAPIGWVQRIEGAASSALTTQVGGTHFALSPFDNTLNHQTDQSTRNAMEDTEPLSAVTRVWQNADIRRLIWDALDIEPCQYAQNSYLLLISKEIFEELAGYVWRMFWLPLGIPWLMKQVDKGYFLGDNFEVYRHAVRAIYLDYPAMEPSTQLTMPDRDDHCARGTLKILETVFPNYTDVVTGPVFPEPRSTRFTWTEDGAHPNVYVRLPTRTRSGIYDPEDPVSMPFEIRGIPTVRLMTSPRLPRSSTDTLVDFVKSGWIARLQWRTSVGISVSADSDPAKNEWVLLELDIRHEEPAEVAPLHIRMCGIVTAELIWRIMLLASHAKDLVDIELFLFKPPFDCAQVQATMDDSHGSHAVARWQSLGTRCKEYRLPVSVPPSRAEITPESPAEETHVDPLEPWLRRPEMRVSCLDLRSVVFTMHQPTVDNESKYQPVDHDTFFDRYDAESLEAIGPTLGPICQVMWERIAPKSEHAQIQVMSSANKDKSTT